MKEALHLILMILGFIAILYGAYYATKLLAPKLTSSKEARYIRIVDKVYLGKEKLICIVQVGEKLFLVGITGHHIEPIGLLEGKDLIPLEMEEEKTFFGFLDDFIKNPHEGEEDSIHRIGEMQDGVREIKKNIREL